LLAIRLLVIVIVFPEYKRALCETMVDKIARSPPRIVRGEECEIFSDEIFDSGVHDRAGLISKVFDLSLQIGDITSILVGGNVLKQVGFKGECVRKGI